MNAHAQLALRAPAVFRGRTAARPRARAANARWVSTSPTSAARCDGRADARRAIFGTNGRAKRDVRASAAEDSGAPRASVAVTAISSPAEANAEVAETSSAPANAPAPMPDAPRIKPRPKPGPVALDRLQAVVLAGGTSSGNPLTKFDARASLKFGASYRLIDFPMANIINSGLKRAFVLTQFNSYTLNQHVQAAYPPEVFGFGSQGYVDVLPSFQTVDEKDWSTGSADCVRRHYKAGSLRGPSFVEEPEAYLILSGEALYRMDYAEMFRTHNETGAGITIATVSRRIGDLDVTNLGVCGVAPTEAGTRARGEVFAFQERPSREELETVAVGPTPDGTALTDCDVHVNMGVYIFSKSAMDSLLGVIELCSERLDFGKDILPMAIRAGVEVRAHVHEGYWQPIRNLREWYDANLSLCKTKSDETNAMSMIDAEFPIYTVPRCLPPARFRGEVYSEGSIVSEGVVVGDGAVVVDSIVGPCVVLGEGVQVRESIFIGHQETGYLHGDGAPDVGKDSVLKNCVVHSDVVIGEGCVLTNEAGVLEHNGVDIQSGKGYMIQDGIIVFMPGTKVEPGTVI